MIGWSRGFPPEAGMYLVEIQDGDMVVTPWSDGRRYIEADGEYQRRGWTALTHSRAKVQRWISVKDLRELLESADV